MNKFRIGAAALAMLGSVYATTASAVTSFKVDETVSGVVVAPVAEGCVGLFFTSASCTLTGNLGAVATDYTFDANSVGDSVYEADFIDWGIALSGWAPTGGGLYDIAINLAFESPSIASGVSTGTAGFGVLLGTLSGGFLTWAGGGVGSIAFADGSILEYDLDDVLVGGLGTTTTSGIRFTAKSLPAAVPLPAAGFLLLGAVGGLAALRRRKDRAVA